MDCGPSIDELISLARSYQSAKDQVWIEKHQCDSSSSTTSSSVSSIPQKMSEKLMTVRNTIQNALSETSAVSSDVANTVKFLNKDMIKMNKLVQNFDVNLKDLEQRLNIMETKGTSIGNKASKIEDKPQPVSTGDFSSNGMS